LCGYFCSISEFLPIGINSLTREARSGSRFPMSRFPDCFDVMISVLPIRAVPISTPRALDQRYPGFSILLPGLLITTVPSSDCLSPRCRDFPITFRSLDVPIAGSPDLLPPLPIYSTASQIGVGLSHPSSFSFAVNSSGFPYQRHKCESVISVNQW
jgi:hypothetical protein